MKNSCQTAAWIILLCVLVWQQSLAAALIAGIVLTLLIGPPFPALSRQITKPLFQTCVALLGFGMDFEKVVKAGVNGALFAALSITATVLLGFWLGKWMRIGRKTSALIGSGTAICGGSAIAAVGPVIAATQTEMALAIGAVFLLNAVALVVFPLLGSALELTQHQFGLWAGIAIHDISSVVGAASVYGNEALQTATAVKLSRTLWIVPLTLAMSLLARRWHGEAEGAGKAKIAIPWFIGFFLLASLARHFFPWIAEHTPRIDMGVKAGMTVALCLIGAGVSPEALRQMGWKVAVQAVLLWIFISITALALARFGN